MRNLKFYEAIREATAISLQDDPSVYLIGLGVPDPKGIFGTTVIIDLHRPLTYIDHLAVFKNQEN